MSKDIGLNMLRTAPHHERPLQAGRLPWNLSHLVGSFQSPSTTATAVSPSDYATNQAVGVPGGIISSGAPGTLPHPLPHYSTHHYASSPQTTAASYHQADLVSWGAPGGGGASNLGMHGHSSPLTGLTSAAMSAASAVADGAPGSSVGGPYGPTKMDPENIPSMYYPHQISSSPAGGTGDPASDTSAAVASSAVASSSTTSSLAATTAAMASATAATASSIDPLTFQSIPPIESQEVISTLHQYFNQSEMPQLGEDGAWIDPAVAAAAAVAHHPGLAAVPYHPDYGDGRGGYKDRKKAIIKEWTKNQPSTSSSGAHGSSSSTSIVDPGAIAAAHAASLSSRSANLGSGVVPSPYNDYYTPYGSTSGKEDAASAQLREYYGHQAHVQAHAYAAYAAQDPALYPYAAAAAAVGNLAVHSGNHPHHLAAAVASHSGHPHHGHHSHASTGHLSVNPGVSIGGNVSGGGGIHGGGIQPGMHVGGSGRPRERRHKSKHNHPQHAEIPGFVGIGSPGSALSRDERKATNLRLPITVMDIINLPMDEFNDLLSKHELTEEQLTLCRDIRRRGKNKVAARNCRKRKIDQIKQLEDDVGRIRNQKGELVREHERLMAQRSHWTDMVKRLHDHVLKELGHDPNLWQLQMDHNRQVHILPRSHSQETDPTKTPRPYHYAPSLGPPMMEGAGGLPSQR